MKLHGSIDWKLESRLRGPLPAVELELADPLHDPAYTPALVFGQSGKLQVEGPYMDLLQRFSSDLRRAMTLTIVGYSFRDDHINYYIADWLSGNDKRQLRIVNRSDLLSRAQGRGFLGRLERLQEESPSRIDLVQLKAGEGMEKLWPGKGSPGS